MPSELNSYLWKALLSVLTLMQAIGLGVMWRTYDALTETRDLTRETQQRQVEVIVPRLERVEREVYRLTDDEPRRP